MSLQPQHSFEAEFPNFERQLADDALLRAQHENLCLAAGLTTCHEPGEFGEIESVDYSERIFRELLSNALAAETTQISHSRLRTWAQRAREAYAGVTVLDRRVCIDEHGAETSRLLVHLKVKPPMDAVVYGPGRLYAFRGGPVYLHVSMTSGDTPDPSIEILPLYSPRAFLGELYLYSTCPKANVGPIIPDNETFLMSRAYLLARETASALGGNIRISGLTLNISAPLTSAQFSFHTNRGEIGVALNMNESTGSFSLSVDPDGIIEAL